MKKITYCTALFMFGSVGAFAQNSLTVNISNIKKPKGTVEIGLFNSEKGFLKDGAQYLKKKIKVTGNSVHYTFKNLPKGNYAVALYHDENLNNKVDTNFLGIPTEGYGFSQNFKPKLSAPEFHQIKIYVENAKTIDISLIN